MNIFRRFSITRLFCIKSESPHVQLHSKPNQVLDTDRVLSVPNLLAAIWKVWKVDKEKSILKTPAENKWHRYLGVGLFLISLNRMRTSQEENKIGACTSILKKRKKVNAISACGRMGSSHDWRISVTVHFHGSLTPNEWPKFAWRWVILSSHNFSRIFVNRVRCIPLGENESLSYVNVNA